MEDPVAVGGVATDNSTFPKDVYSNATLQVPVGREAKYRNTAGWRDFTSIQDDIDDLPDGIASIETDDQKPYGTSSDKPATEVARYNMKGQRISSPQKGVNIILYSDGSRKKVWVK